MHACCSHCGTTRTLAAGPVAKLLGKLGLGKKKETQEKAADQKAEAEAPVLAGSAVVYRMPVSFDPSILDIMGVSALPVPACRPCHFCKGSACLPSGACRCHGFTALLAVAAGAGCPQCLPAGRCRC